jgi:hypothetical protein
MAVLPDADRAAVRDAVMRLAPALLGGCAFTKPELRAAVDATDAWIDSNQTSFNTALPVAFRNSATLTQKTLVFCYVAMKRAGVI